MWTLGQGCTEPPAMGHVAPALLWPPRPAPPPSLRRCKQAPPPERGRAHIQGRSGFQLGNGAVNRAPENLEDLGKGLNWQDH